MIGAIDARAASFACPPCPGSSFSPVGPRIEQLRRAPGRIGRNVSVATRLALVVVIVALVSMVVTSLVGLERGRDLAENEIRSRLSSGAAARVDAVERYIAGLERAVVGQAITPRPAAAIEALGDTFGELDAQTPTARDQRDVEAYYTEVVAPELAEARGRPVGVAGLVPVSNAAVTIQAQDVVPDNDDRPVPEELEEWSSIHDPLDDAFREFSRRSGFSKLYMIEPENYVVVYSSERHIDAATSLRSGPHSGTQLASLIDELAADPQPGTVAIRDFAPYAPVADEPAAFIGSPTFVDGELAGFVVGRFSPDDLTAIMTSNETWTWQGDTGETYIVASDGFMRTDSREFLEDRAAFFEQVESVGIVSEDEIRSMERFDTTVLFQPIDYRQVDTTFETGRVGVTESVNYLGRDVLAERETLDIAGLDWAVFSETGVDEIRAPIDDFVRNLLITVAVFIVVVTFIAVRWADRLLEPLRRISARLRSIGSGAEPPPRTELPASSADEFVALAADIDIMLDTLNRRTMSSRRQTDELRRVLRRLLPASVAERAEAGDRDVIEQVATASVAVVVIGGLGRLMSAGEPERVRSLLDRFVAEADELADERKLDRLQLTGDTYIAACGVSRPHLDHTARAAGFLLDIFDLVHDLDPDDELFVRAGLAVGPITVGLTGGSQLIHETWGVTVQRATDLARSAGPGQVLVSSDCARLLPERYRLEPSNVADASVLSAVETPLDVTT